MGHNASRQDGPPPNCTDHELAHDLLLVWHGVVLAVGLPLNAVALAVFACLLARANQAVVYLANLAACDLLFTLALPFRLYFYAAGDWPFGDALCQAAGSLFQINLSGSCLFLAAINADRCLALAYPLRFRHLRRPPVARRVCAAIWAAIVLGSVPVALAHDTSLCLGPGGRRERRCFEGFSDRAWRRELLPLVGAQFLLGFLLPLVAVLCSSGRVLWALRGRPSTPSSPGPSSGRRRKTVKLLVVNAAIFVVCFAPYNVALLAYAAQRASVNQEDGRRPSTARWALQVATLLSCANCCLDPLVYYFSAEGFRRTLRARAGAGGPTGKGRTGPRREEGAMVPIVEGGNGNAQEDL